MKFAKITLSVALLGVVTLGMADNVPTNTTNNPAATIDSQIAAIQAAPAQERVQMMNEFKQKLMQMNQEDRMAAIAEMQKEMAGHKDAMQQQGEQMQAQMQEHMQEKMQKHAEGMQMEHMQDMTQMQNMNQHQAGNQWQHEQNDIMQHNGGMQQNTHNNNMFGGRK